MNQIILKNDKISVGILPECGGSLSFFKYLGQDVLRPTDENQFDSNLSALFVMIPYASFITNGKFPYFGITRSVAVNSNISEYPIHGDVWQQKLQIVQQNDSIVELKLVHKKENGFPYNYTAGVIYELKDGKLLITLKLKNDTPLPMPYGLGIHPFFKRNKKTKIQYNAQNIWYCGGDPIMGHPYPISKDLNFTEAKILPHIGLNISVDNWDGIAQVIQDNYSVTIQADNSFGHLTLYAPRGKDFFCLEPVSHTPDAFNLAAQGIVGTGIQTLGPNESATNTITFTMKGKQ